MAQINKGLKLYQQRIKEAKAIGGEYLEYTKLYYKTKKEFKPKTAYINVEKGKIIRKKIVVPSNKNNDVFNTYEEYIRIKSKLRVTSAKEYINKVFGIIDDEAAQRMAQYLITKGIVYPNINRLKHRQLTSEEWALLKDAYKTNYAEAQTGETYNEYFFGS